MTTTADHILKGTFASLPITVDVPTQRICDMLVGAFEGGSNYWYSELHYDLPEGITYDDFREGGKFTDPDNYHHPLELVPFVDGCALTLKDAEGDEPDKVYRIDKAALLKGLKLFAKDEKLKHHWRDFIDENDDAITADVFLQFVVFGECIYG